ncbi:MAG: FHA domain-containing protein [Deltaproteobacteria bacterium]|nr:FHA domain-containing protein [Deltaproteobacteria bacterium]
MRSPTPTTEKMLSLARLEAEATLQGIGSGWILVHRGRAYPLPRSGTLVIGRGPRCDILLDAPVVSREHCRVSITNEGVCIEDLNSSNGVYVNGQRVDKPQELAAGDQISLGRESLLLCQMTSDQRAAAARSPTPPSAPKESDDEIPPSSRRDRPEMDPYVLTTQKADAFETLGRLADRMLASGRLDAAEKLLSGHLNAVLASSSSASDIPDELIEIASRYALKLAAARLDGIWIDLVLECHTAFRRPLSEESLEQTRALLAHRLKINPVLLSKYQEVLRQAVGAGKLRESETIRTILALDLG